MKTSLCLAAAVVVAALAPAAAADFAYDGFARGPVAVPLRPIILPDCYDRRELPGFRCAGNRVFVNQDEEPWVGKMTEISGPRIRPYQRLYRRSWGR